MAVSKAQQKAVNKYMAANYDRINLTVGKGQRDTIKAHAESRGKSVNRFINEAIAEKMERDGTGGTQSPVGATEGIITPMTIKAAQDASRAAGETLPVFMARAVEETADRDALRELDRKKGG